jgi:hypothetical protein
VHGLKLKTDLGFPRGLNWPGLDFNIRATGNPLHARYLLASCVRSERRDRREAHRGRREGDGGDEGTCGGSFWIDWDGKKSSKPMA